VKRIVISRIDAIGDVLLTLPLAVCLRRKFPEVEIIFLGQNYTESLVRLCGSIDEFVSWERVQSEPDYLKSVNADCLIHVFPNRMLAKIAKQARIPIRIGSVTRWFNFLTCNRWVWVHRRKLQLHEAQMNLMVAKPLGIDSWVTLSEIAGMDLINPRQVEGEFDEFLDAGRTNLVIHPGSRMHAPEWGSENFCRLVAELDPALFNIIVTGTKVDQSRVKPILARHPSVTNAADRFDLDQLIRFLGQCDIVVSNSTGPMHLAAIQGVAAIGLFSRTKGVDATRWGPIGPNSVVIEAEKACVDCNKTKICRCVEGIPVERVLDAVIASASSIKDRLKPISV
jgi:ADP-heptose:LPS heptosyltransferase